MAALPCRRVRGTADEAAPGDRLPLGAICVFDDAPRQVQLQDIAALRDFALAARRRIGALAREQSTRRRLAAQ